MPDRNPENFHPLFQRYMREGDLDALRRVSSPQPQSGHAIEIFRRQPDGNWHLLIGDPFTVQVAAEAEAASTGVGRGSR